VSLLGLAVVNTALVVLADLREIGTDIYCVAVHTRVVVACDLVEQHVVLLGDALLVGAHGLFVLEIVELADLRVEPAIVGKVVGDLLHDEEIALTGRRIVERDNRWLAQLIVVVVEEEVIPIALGVTVTLRDSHYHVVLRGVAARLAVGADKVADQVAGDLHLLSPLREDRLQCIRAARKQ